MGLEITGDSIGISIMEVTDRHFTYLAKVLQVDKDKIFYLSNNSRDFRHMYLEMLEHGILDNIDHEPKQ